jgi:hypothetical protein
MWRQLFCDGFVDPAWRKSALRPNYAEMSRAAFAGLITAWSGALSVLLLVAVGFRVLR